MPEGRLVVRQRCKPPCLFRRLCCVNVFLRVNVYITEVIRDDKRRTWFVSVQIEETY